MYSTSCNGMIEAADSSLLTNAHAARIKCALSSYRMLRDWIDRHSVGSEKPVSSNIDVAEDLPSSFEYGFRTLPVAVQRRSNATYVVNLLSDWQKTWKMLLLDKEDVFGNEVM